MKIEKNEQKECFKSFGIAIKSKTEKGFKGMLSTYGNTDFDGDVFEVGAFTESVENKAVVPLLWNHLRNNVAGILHLKDTEKGVECEAEWADNENAKTVSYLIDKGAIDSLSVGCWVQEFDFNETGLSIKKAEIFEGSAVMLPANPEAAITEVKELKEKENEKMKMEEFKKELEELKSKIDSAEKSNEGGKEEEIKALEERIKTLVKQVEEKEKEKEDILKSEDEGKKGLVNKDYLKSKTCLFDFAKTLQKAGQKNVEWKELWRNELQTKGITDPTVLYPDAVIQEVRDAMQEEGKLLTFIRQIPGLTKWKVVNETLGEIGSGYNRATEEEKKEQTLTFVERIINTQFIYKYQKIDKEILKEDNMGIILNYLLNELPKRLVLTIEKAIAVGDGLSDVDAYKIKQIKSIVEDEAFFKTDFYLGAGNPLSKTAISQLEKGIREGSFVYIMNRKTFVDLKALTIENTNQPVFLIGTVTINGMVYPTLDGVPVVEQDYMTAFEDGTGNVPLIIALKRNSYVYISDKNEFDFYRDFDLSINKEEMLVEAYCGGSLNEKESAAVLFFGDEPVA